MEILNEIRLIENFLKVVVYFSLNFLIFVESKILEYYNEI